MKKAGKYTKRSMGKIVLYSITTLVCILALAIAVGGFFLLWRAQNKESSAATEPSATVAETEAPADEDLFDSGEYAAVLTLTAEEAAEIDFLAAMERMELADGSGGYLLTREEYETLLSLLPEVDPADDLPAGEPILIRIQD